MKKLFVLIAVVCTFFVIASCDQIARTDAEIIEEAAAYLFDGVDLNNVLEDLEFVTSSKGVTFTYSSSDVNVISAEGKVTPKDNDQLVVITVKCTFGQTTISKTYRVTVPGSNPNPGPDPEDKTETKTLAEVKALASDTEVKVEAIVAIVVNGTDKNVPVGFYVADATDAIYVYSSEFAANVKAGDKVVLVGQYTKYVDATTITQAEAQGYTGARQIVPTSCTVESSNNEIPTTGFTASSIAALREIPVSTNITSNVYEVTCTIRKSQGVGFVNYYFDDLNGTDSYYAYSTANGKDLGWLEQYDGQVRRCYIAVQNCKLSASGSFWRIYPVLVCEEVQVSDDVKVGYALDRLCAQFEAKYSSTYSFDLVKADAKLEGAVVTYTSNNEAVKFTTEEDKVVCNVTVTETLVNAKVTVSVEYNGKTTTRDVNLALQAEKFNAETITIAEARQVALKETVTVKGIVVGFLYMSGTSKPAGLEIIDETGSMAVFISTAVDAKTDITKISLGEWVYVTGDSDRYQPKDEYNHTGSVRLNNAEVIYHDYQNNEVPSTWIQEKVLGDICTNASDNNISNIVYKSRFYIEYSGTSYKNYYIHDLDDPSLSMTVYSQNSGTNGPGEYAWLQQYAGKCVEGLVTARIGAVSSKKWVWKSAVLQVFNVIETPDSVKAYGTVGAITSAFATEYTKAAEVRIAVGEGSLALKSCTSTQVKFSENGDGYFVNVAEPTQSEDVTLVLTYTLNSYSKDITITFKITAVETITIAEARAQAVKSGPTVGIKGVVSALTRFDGDATWGFYVTDATQTIYVKTKAAVTVGQEVVVVGPLDLYYGMPQIGSNATITLTGETKEVPAGGYKDNATIADLAAANTAGEAGKCGAMYYAKVSATLHISSSKCYISVGDVEIGLYNYTNAKFYAYNYAPLEELDGKEVMLDLVAYNVYNGVYTYVIAKVVC